MKSYETKLEVEYEKEAVYCENICLQYCPRIHLLFR